MKTNLIKKLLPYKTGTLAKKLKPYTTKRLEAEGKAQIKAALKNAGLDDIDNLDADEDEPIQEGEELDNLPDPMDLAKDQFLDEFMRGEH